MLNGNNRQVAQGCRHAEGRQEASLYSEGKVWRGPFVGILDKVAVSGLEEFENRSYYLHVGIRGA